MTQGEKPQTTRRYRLARFGLRAVFGAMLGVAALLAAYRVGFERGRNLGPLVPLNLTATTIYAREYDVSDIVKSEADAQILIASLKERVEVDSWDVVGGYADIRYNAKVNSFTISQVWPGHVSVVKYLSHVREFASGRKNLAASLADAETSW
jgi:hypothetical protein